MPTRKWKDIRDNVRMTEEGRAAARLANIAEDLGIPVAELRRVNDFTRVELAHRLAVTQGAVSELEGNPIFSIPTIRRYVEALGARLELSAVFDDGRRVLLDI